MADENEKCENVKNVANTVENDDDEELSEEGRIEAEKVRDEINKKVGEQYRDFESSVMNVFNQRIASMENHIDDNLTKKVTTAQLDILKVNKTFREICRPLGGRWKELFKELTSDLPAEQTSSEINLIEKQSSTLLQPYKALMAWKELRGEAFRIEDLVGALDKLGFEDIKKKAVDILKIDSSDDLIKISTSVDAIGDNKTTTVNNKAHKPSTTTTNLPPSIQSIPSTQSTQSNSSTDHLNPEESLDDRHLLLLSKKMTDCWHKVALELGVSQEEVDELVKSEGQTNYQAAFRMLYGWREGSSDSDKNLNSLLSALRHIGRPDLINSLK